MRPLALKKTHVVVGLALPILFLFAGMTNAQTVTIVDDCSYPQANERDYGLTMADIEFSNNAPLPGESVTITAHIHNYALSGARSGWGHYTGWQPYGERYAIIVMGGNVDPGSQLYAWYWGDTYGMYTELQEHGFADDNIYFLSYGPSADAHPEAVDAISTTENIQLAYQWAAEVSTEQDLLYIYWIDHGSQNGFQTNNGSISHAALAGLMAPISAAQIIGAYNPCYSGCVIDDVSALGVITVTSQDCYHSNSWGWAGKWRQALRGGTEDDPTDADGDGYISMTETYEWIAPKSQAAGEHSMYDDNGDGVGSEYGQAGFDPHDPEEDGYNGKFYSLDGWMMEGIPSICHSPSQLTNDCGVGQDAPSQSFEVWNCGDGLLSYTISDDADWGGQDWLSCAPYQDTSTGEHDTITCTFATAGLPCGSDTATITISDPSADNDPQTIPADLTVHCAPAICYSVVASVSCELGKTCSASFEVWNCGTGELVYFISGGTDWLSYNPSGGTSTGEQDTITLTYSTTGLGTGSYSTTITISDPNADNDPQTIPVDLVVFCPPPPPKDAQRIYDHRPNGGGWHEIIRR